MNRPVATGNLEGHNDKSNANLVDLGDVRLREDDVQEQVKPGEHLEDEKGDKKACIRLLSFETINPTFAPFRGTFNNTSLVCKKFTDVNRSHIYKYVHIHLGQQCKEAGPDNKNLGLEEFGQFFTTLLQQDHLRARVVSLAFTLPSRPLPPSPKPSGKPAQPSKNP